VAVTRQDIEGWIAEALRERRKNANVTHLIIGLDPFDYENFPIVVEGGSDGCQKRLDELYRSGNRADEVYDLRLDLKAQLAERKAWHV